MENSERKYAPIVLWSYFIDILAFEPGKLCPGDGDFVSFFPTTENLSPGRGF